MFKYDKYEYRFILESSKMMKIVKVVKKPKCWLLTLKSQTLADNIFKYDLNFKKINVDSWSGGQN